MRICKISKRDNNKSFVSVSPIREKNFTAAANHAETVSIAAAREFATIITISIP